MARIVALLLALVATGCVSIDGGAVEASWDVHASDGRGIADCSCTCPEVAKVRFSVVPAAGGADLCAGRAACQFSCQAKHGATPFDIPPGDYSLSLVPVGADGQDLTGAAPQAGGGTCSAHSGVDPISANHRRRSAHPTERSLPRCRLRARLRRVGQQQGLHASVALGQPVVV